MPSEPADVKDLMTVREVAAYLRLKERKVYDLVAHRAIPCARVGGKWLFPRALVDAWVMDQLEGEPPCRTPELPAILAGSHDPLLEWAARESGSDLALLLDGSVSGVERLASRGATATGLHIVDPAGEDNIGYVQARLSTAPVVLIAWARRRQGLIVAAGNPAGVQGIADLPRLRLAVRQKEAGSYLLLDHLLRSAGLPSAVHLAAGPPVRSETDVALAVADGRADAGLGIEAVARQLRLGFVPLREERFDLLVWRRAWFEPPLQRLMAVTRSAAFQERAGTLAGYDIGELGRVRWNGP